MRKYDLIIIGTGSAMNYVDQIIRKNQDIRIAVIDKDEPGGICLTLGCIPSKILLYPAELVRTIKNAGKFGIDAEVKDIDFLSVMERMRTIVSEDIERIRRGLSTSKNIAYYPDIAEFVSPYALKVGGNIITSGMIFLCTGSKPGIPPIKGLDKAGYLTSNTVLKLTKLPKSIVIVGGGYIAAEYSHFFSAMGSKVTVIGRNPRFVPNEEPEVSELAERKMSKYMNIITSREVIEVQKAGRRKKVISQDISNGKKTEVIADEILVAAGRISNTDMLHPERSGIKTDKNGWIVVNEYLQASQPNIWAFGDANGKYLFKHVANYESLVVYFNAFLKQGLKVDYHAVPHAIFSHPEIAGVGLSERGAIEKYGEEDILIGFRRYQDTAKGMIMDAKDCFVKVIVQKGTNKILGAHIIGPYASILIHEIINLMYVPDRSAYPIFYGMHIHPSLSEVVDKAFNSLLPPKHYHHILEELKLE